MNANIVYQVAKSLPQTEQRELFYMLQKKFGIEPLNAKRKLQQPTLTKEQAYHYLIKNVFNKKR